MKYGAIFSPNYGMGDDDKHFVCIECGLRVKQIYITYGLTNIRLIKCNNCLEFVDKYCEYDPVAIFMDIILVKKQAYRHLIFNGTEYGAAGSNDGLVKLGILLNLFEVYMKWIVDDDILIDGNVLMRYFEVLASCIAEFVVFHLVVRIMATIIVNLVSNPVKAVDNDGKETVENVGVAKKYWNSRYANMMLMALIMSSFGKMFLIILVVWQHSLTNPTKIVNFFVFCCNYRAIDGKRLNDLVFLERGWPSTFITLAIGTIAKAFIRSLL